MALAVARAAACAGHSCVLSWWQEVKAKPHPSVERYRDGRALRPAYADVVSAQHRPCSNVCRTTANCPHARCANGRDKRFCTRNQKPYIYAGRLWDEAKNLAALDAVAPQLDWPILRCGAMPNVPEMRRCRK
jgi:hypothetical protein